MLAKHANDLSQSLLIKSINQNIFEEIRKNANAGFTQVSIPFEQFNKLSYGFPKTLEMDLQKLGYTVSYYGDYLLGQKVYVIISWQEAK